MIDRAVFWVFALWFVFQGAFYAFNVSFGVFPDEYEHYRVILGWFENPGFWLVDSQVTNAFGQVSARAPLFYSLMGALLYPFRSLDDEFRFLFVRVCCLGMNLATFVVTDRILSVLKVKTFARVIVLAIMSNALMFNFMSGAINYDSLLILFCTVSTGLLVAAFEQRRLNLLIVSVAFLGLAALTKISALLFAVAWAAAAFVLVLSPRGRFWRWPGLPLRRLLGVCALAGTFAGAALWLHGSNVVRYGALFPNCADVRGKEWCLANVEEYRVNAAIQADRATTPRMSLKSFSRFFLVDVQKSFWGIFSHRSMPKDNGLELYLGLYLVSLVGWVLWVSRVGFERSRSLVALGAAAAVFLVGFLLQNYRGYLSHGLYGAALQGRYLFPVIVPGALVLGVPIGETLKRNRVSWIFLLVGISAFVHHGFYEFIRRADAGWYR
jgi:hypothetical protein